MLWQRRYCWALASIIALGLLLTVFLISTRNEEDIRNAGVHIFKGKLPQIPEYEPDHRAYAYADADEAPNNTHPSTSIRSTTFAPTPKPAAQWDPVWDDRAKWPKWSRPNHTFHIELDHPNIHIPQLDKYV
jgi:hypothetical protein